MPSSPQAGVAVKAPARSNPPFRGTVPSKFKNDEPESWDGMTTDVQEIKRSLKEQHDKNPHSSIDTLRPRARTPGRGVRSPRSGTHHDGE